MITLLVERSKQGDLDAFSQLISVYRVRVYGVAFSFLHNHQDAEDISQEAFIQAFKKLGSLNPSSSFEPWLFQVVANMSRNKIRWRGVREKFTISLDAEPDSGGENDIAKLQVADPDRKIDPSFQADHTMLTKQLNNAVTKLPIQQRTAIHLKFIQGFKILEVAKLMRLSEGTVKTHIFRGLESLKIRLERQV